MNNTSVQTAPQPQPISFDSHTEELLKQIKEKNVKLDHDVHELLNHVLGNKLQGIMFALGDFLDTPKWILNSGSYLMIFLYRLSGRKGLGTIQYRMQRALKNAELIKEFLGRLREATGEKKGF